MSVPRLESGMSTVAAMVELNVNVVPPEPTNSRLDPTTEAFKVWSPVSPVRIYTPATFVTAMLDSRVRVSRHSAGYAGNG